MTQSDTTTTGPSPPPIVRFSGVSKHYGAFRALHDIDLEIQRGEFLTLLGPSGSGKTTSLMLLAGFDTPTSGTIAMDGTRIEGLPAHKRDIGVVFQNYALFPHLTVAENLAFPLSVRRVPKAEIGERVEKALSLVHLDGMGGRKPSQLSGGQQQRVALARAIIFKPRLILLDEPLGALDKNLREHMQAELKHLHRQLGITMVFVTHDQSEALNLSDRVAVFNKGRLEQIDAPELLYERPCTPFVASFIGENNLLDGRIEALAAGQAAIRLDRGTVLTMKVAGQSAIGDRVKVGIRPEHVKVGGGEGAFAATVAEISYLGDARRVAVECDGIGRMALKLPTGAEAGQIGIGDEIRVVIPETLCRALPVTGGE
ncbi:ABC transporter ATP-binding protein [Mesorhizobium sp. L103C105A0]|uniref:ABC transporter ATP-binding protein n=1 Tax=unclassified Mesorhizobium TaxID=325217 RepID=UPI0003F634ED|nr:ABC transporter ATP-binding protein [Mesorhizobium sp. L103C105A0]